MARTRALLTETDRQLIAEDGEYEENQRHQSISRVRNRIRDELGTDVAILREHHPTLFDELQSVVCED